MGSVFPVVNGLAPPPSPPFPSCRPPCYGRLLLLPYHPVPTLPQLCRANPTRTPSFSNCGMYSKKRVRSLTITINHPFVPTHTLKKMSNTLVLHSKQTAVCFTSYRADVTTMGTLFSCILITCAPSSCVSGLLKILSTIRTL